MVADLQSVIDRHQQWLTLLPRVKPFYAVKCNNTPTVLRVLRALSIGFDCASKVPKTISTLDQGPVKPF